MAIIVSPKWKKHYDEELAAGRITKAQWTYAVTGVKPKDYSDKAPNDPDDKPKGNPVTSRRRTEAQAAAKPSASKAAPKGKGKGKGKGGRKRDPFLGMPGTFDPKTGKLYGLWGDENAGLLASPRPVDVGPYNVKVPTIRKPGPHQKPPPRTDWRYAPGGGFVDIKHPDKPGHNIPEFHGKDEDIALANKILSDPGYTDEAHHQARKYLNAVAAVRKEQMQSFGKLKKGEADRKAEDALNKMRARWAAEAHKRFAPWFDWRNEKDEGFFHGITEVPGNALDVAKGVGAVGQAAAEGAQGKIDQWMTGLSAAGRGRPEMAKPIVGKDYAEHVAEFGAGKALTNAALHGDFSHPWSIAADAALLLVGTAASPFKLGGAAARAAFRARNAERSLEARVLSPTIEILGSENLVPLQPHTNLIGDTDVTVIDGLIAEMTDSPARQTLITGMATQMPRKFVEAALKMVDSLALRVHADLTAMIPDEITRLDGLVAAGKATEQDLALRKELGFMQRFGVPVDYFYKQLHEAGAGIPEAVQRYFKLKQPNKQWNFLQGKFDRPIMTGKTYSEESVAKRLLAKINPANADKGFPVNPKVYAKEGRFKGLQVAGPIEDEEWFRRLVAVMPSKVERTYWANWYRTFEPLFREAFGADADAIMRGFAASQANTSPTGGVGVVLKVMDRLRRGEKVSKKGIGMVALNVEKAIKNVGMDEGMAAKLNDFTDALAQMPRRTWMGLKKEGGRPAPSDIWAGRDAGHVDGPMATYLEREFGLKRDVDFVVDNGGKIAGHVYERISEQYNRIADMLNAMGKNGFDGHQWTPADVQAVGWGSIQKMVNVNPEDIRMALEGNAWEVATEVTKGVTGIGADLSIPQANHVGRMFEDDIRALAESHPGIYLLPGTDFKFTTGGWSGGQNGAIQFKVIGAQRDIQDFTTRLAVAFDQEYVQASRWTSSASHKPKSALIISSPKFVDEAAKQQFFDALHAVSPESRNHATKQTEKELQGYMAGAEVDGNPSINIRTHRASATGKDRQPFIDRYKDAIAQAEKATGIKVKLGQENMALIVGSQHGAEDALASAAGKAGGRRGRVDDKLAARIRAKLEPAVAGVRAGGAEAEPGVLGSWDDWTGSFLHGVHTRNLGRGVIGDAMGLPVGMSAIHVSEHTPLPGRTWLHELSHYLDTQILARFNEKGVADPLLARMSAKDRQAVTDLLGDADPEVFSAAWEEYVLAAGERNPNVPEDIKPALKFLSDFMKEETQKAYWERGYRGVATDERIPLPQAVHDLFDSLHWYEAKTGRTFEPGVTTPEDALNHMADAIMGSTDDVADIDRQILRVDNQMDKLVNERARELGGGEKGGPFMASGGRDQRPQREWIPKYTKRGRSRGAIGGHAGGYIDAPMRTGNGPRYTAWENAKRVAKAQLEAEEGGQYNALADARNALQTQREATYPDWAISGWTEHGMEADDAEQAVRFLSMFDRNQPFTEAHKTFRTWGWNRAVERFADAVSNSLMGEGRMASAARRIAPNAATDMRIPKEAARRLHHDAERALAELHAAVKALPKEGSAADTAHYWWAQLPEEMQNLDGLRAVRDRMIEERDAIKNGSVLEEIKTALDGVESDLKDWGIENPDEFPAELLERQSSLNGLIVDLPHRMEDLSRAVEHTNIVIGAKPQVDQKILDAMREISMERRAILEEAGLLDAETADARTGLLGEWLNHEPDGNEIFVGHRGGKIRSSESILPNRVGTGKPTTPAGVRQENRLVLANSGRLRPSTHVVFEDWVAASYYKNAMRTRDELGQMGPAFDGRRLADDEVLINPKGHVVPSHVKRDPLAGVSEEMEHEIQSMVKTTVDSFLAETPEQIEAMKAAALEAKIPLSDLRVVKKNVAKRYFRFAKDRASPSTKGGKIHDEAINFMSASLIFLRAGYIPKNIAQNLIMAVPHQGTMYIVNAPRAAQIMLDPELYALVRAEIGSGLAGALDKEAAGYALLSKGLHKGAGAVTRFADDPIRISAYVHELAKEGVIPKLTPYLRPEDRAAILDHVRTPSNSRHNVMQRMRDSMGDFDRMSIEQRKWARRFLIIPGWLMAGSRYPVHFIITKPARSGLIIYGLAGEPYADKIGLPQNRPITDIIKSKGFNQGIDLGHDIMLRTTSINPISTPIEILSSFLPGSDRPPGGYLNPVIKGGYNLTQRQNKYGRSTGWLDAIKSDIVDSIIPNYDFIHGLVYPKASGTYPGDATRWGRFFRELGVVPIEIKAGGNAAKRATDEWKDKVKAAKEAGVPLPPNWQAAIKSKGDWQSVQAALPDDASEEDKAKAKFELLKTYNPSAYRENKAFAYQSFADPQAVGAADAITENLLGWGNLNTMSGATNAVKRKEASDGLAKSTTP